MCTEETLLGKELKPSCKVNNVGVISIKNMGGLH